MHKTPTILDEVQALVISLPCLACYDVCTVVIFLVAASVYGLGEALVQPTKKTIEACRLQFKSLTDLAALHSN